MIVPAGISYYSDLCSCVNSNSVCCDFLKVLQIFEEIQKKHVHGELNAGFETDIADLHRDLTVSQTDLSEIKTDSGIGCVTPADSQSSLDLSQHDQQEEESL